VIARDGERRQGDFQRYAGIVDGLAIAAKFAV
jgi:hypothetical protein